jgi:periplasmic divalent cation tolerance protein
MNLVEIRVSCPDLAVADAIGAAAVEARVAACAHVTPLRSIYRWEGRVERAEEYAVSLKTREDLADRVAALIRDRHPYDLPTIMIHPCRSDEPTAKWIAAETT